VYYAPDQAGGGKVVAGGPEFRVINVTEDDAVLADT
jgi:hypothetical protein